MVNNYNYKLAVPINENIKNPSDIEEIELQETNRRENRTSAEKDGKTIWRIANGFMTIFFLMASGVQFNDPDPYLWVPLYGTATLLTFSVVIWPNSSGNKKWIWIYSMHAMFCFGMFLYTIVQLVIAATHPLSDGSLNPLTYEEGREMAGVMITAIWLFTCKQSPTIRCTLPDWCDCCRSSSSSSNHFAFFRDKCPSLWKNTDTSNI
ncbi:transmembrane protein 220 isoform X4 [Parasteatoda tepidariorum]|uniref:transmembrane protein 220 isoform X4 n=1 Tax=Parasteatoda tepidariorum TaxID=114398 RepID=UPI0039BD4180